MNLDTIPTGPPDNRRRATRASFSAVVRGVAKPVVGHQLKAELGGADVFTSEGVAQPGTLVVLANVPQAALESAIAAHVADPLFGQPDLKLVTDKAKTDPAFAALARLMGVLPPTKGA